MIINTVQTAKAVEVGRFLKAKEKKNIITKPAGKITQKRQENPKTKVTLENMNFAEAPKIFLNQIKRVVALDIILPKIILVKQIKIIKGVAYLLTSSTQYILFE